jgi:HSP20 family protein
MSLMKWDPFRDLETIQNRLNRFVDAVDPPTFADWNPAVDIEETEKEYIVKADLPEVKKEHVKVNFENGMLTLEGERILENEEKKNRFHKVERSFGKFVRRFAMPTEVDAEHVAATFKDGVLTVRLPKTVTSKRAIEVKVA